ncbi:hypothetical protein N7450_010882 [Penicillium hetheringtonii]|uniref:Uncharacterized protein n=1 Tax=Penicillium hetheringtonii TaxID=911720 RepID=A0AAD6D959_9EURO|nr:hypothetical protein N7450_010882 [Penicillium hetheringtonii]
MVYRRNRREASQIGKLLVIPPPGTVDQVVFTGGSEHLWTNRSQEYQKQIQMDMTLVSELSDFKSRAQGWGRENGKKRRDFGGGRKGKAGLKWEAKGTEVGGYGICPVERMIRALVELMMKQRDEKNTGN